MPKKQADGRYRAKLTIGYTAEGKPIHKYVSGRTKKELEAKKQETISHFVDGGEPARDRLFAEYAVDWYRLKKEPHIAASSRMLYCGCLNKHVLPAFGDRMLRSISSAELQGWINEYAGRSKTLITYLMTIVSSVMEQALAEGILQRDPAAAMVRPKAKPPEEKRALTDEETQVVLETIDRHPDGLFLAVLYYLGLRKGEAAGLQWGDFDWQDRKVHVQRDIDYSESRSGVVGELKTKAGNRYVPIPDELFELLIAKRSLPHLYLFSKKGRPFLSNNVMERMWMHLMIDAGLASKKEGVEKKGRSADVCQDYKADITPHYLRHNYITMLYDAGVDPLVTMRLAGHASYQTTVTIYTHLNNMHLEAAAESINEKFNLKKLPRSCRKPKTEKRDI